LLVSAYTANLASLLVAKVEAPAEFENLDQSARRHKIICAVKDSSEKEWFERTYTDYHFSVEKTIPLQLLKALDVHECDGAILRSFQFEEYRQNLTVKH